MQDIFSFIHVLKIEWTQGEYPYIGDSFFCFSLVSYALPCLQNAVNALYFMKTDKEVAKNM